MNEMIERAARNMATAHAGSTYNAKDINRWLRNPEQDWQIQACAAIEALIEPTDEMIAAGCKLEGDDARPSMIFSTMIRTALGKERDEDE